MARQSQRFQGVPFADHFGPARVLEVDREAGRVQVMMGASDDPAEEHSGPRRAWAQWALPQPCTASWGDTLLIAGQTIDDLYVIGALGFAGQPADDEAPPAEGAELQLQSGARAVVARESDGERLEVYSEQGRLLFSYAPSGGRSRVELPEGDVEFVSRKGKIDFVAAGGVRFFSREPIELTSAAEVRLAALDAAGKTFSALGVGTRRLDLQSEEIRVKSKKGRLEIDRASFVGRSFSSSVKVLRSVAERSESVVGTAIEKARNVYRSVEELSQLRAGRVRTLVSDFYDLKSRNTRIRSDEEVRVDAKRINLG